MATSARAVLEQAYLLSTKNNPAEIAASPEPLNRVIRAQEKFFAVAAAVNPSLFGDRRTVTQTGGRWVRPTDAASIYYLNDAAGAEVAVVPFYDRAAEPARPAVYEVGGAFYPAGRTNDPVGVLTLWCSRAPVAPTSLNSTLDAGFPDNFAPLLATEIAIELAAKDARTEEVPPLRAERDDWLRLFIQYLKGATVTNAARYHRRFLGAGGVVDLNALLAGGSGVTL